uniref:Uncharacterized protein n=1 Tax=Angiostrongylus cantonensis TaxID=6313 RepID=C7TNY4_ANGCA|nr:hypothetical protein [Angiostrongylus cantonensis]
MKTKTSKQKCQLLERSAMRKTSVVAQKEGFVFEESGSRSSYGGSGEIALEYLSCVPPTQSIISKLCFLPPSAYSTHELEYFQAILDTFF